MSETIMRTKQIRFKVGEKDYKFKLLSNIIKVEDLTLTDGTFLTGLTNKAKKICSVKIAKVKSEHYQQGFCYIAYGGNLGISSVIDNYTTTPNYLEFKGNEYFPAPVKNRLKQPISNISTYTLQSKKYYDNIKKDLKHVTIALNKEQKQKLIELCEKLTGTQEEIIINLIEEEHYNQIGMVQ